MERQFAASVDIGSARLQQLIDIGLFDTVAAELDFDRREQTIEATC